jgi:hypothetical protein
MAKKKKASKTGTRNRTATLRLDAAFYPKAALRKAQEAFAHLASIEIRRQGRQQVVKFGGMSATAARKLPDEFANYALSCAVVEE